MTIRVNYTPLLNRLGSKASLIGIPYLWLIIFFLFPFLIILKISISEMEGVSFSPLVTFIEGVMTLKLRLNNYLFILRDDLYFDTYVSSLKFAAITTVLCLLIGYPFAYFMARTRSSVQPILVMLVMLPFWTSFLLRVYAWKGLLTEGGWAWSLIHAVGLNHLLAALNY